MEGSAGLERCCCAPVGAAALSSLQGVTFTMFMNPSKRRQIVGLLVCAVFSACAVLATGQTRAAVGGDKKGDKDDIQRFQGSWSVAKASKNGEDVPEEILKDI